jgi:hypothetical protein
MGFLLTDGFELYRDNTSTLGLFAPTSKWDAANSTNGLGQKPAITTGLSGVGTQAIISSSFTSWIESVSLGTNLTAWAGGGRFQTPSISDKTLIDVYDSAHAVQFRISVNSSGQIELYRGAGVALLVTGAASPPVVIGGIHYMTWDVVIDDTLGSAVITIDGVTVINATGLDTKNTAVVGAETIRFYLQQGGGKWDDIYCTDNGITLGERMFSPLFPESDTATLDWVPDTGTAHWSRVDDRHDSDTSYVQASTPAQTDKFNIQNVGGFVTTIDRVRVGCSTKKTDTTTRQIKAGLDSGGTEAFGADITLSTNYQLVIANFDLDPATGLPWTISGVNAALGVIRVVS